MMDTSFLKIPLAPLGPDHSYDHPVPGAGAMSQHLEKSLAVHWEIMTSQFSPGTSWKYMEIPSVSEDTWWWILMILEMLLDHGMKSDI